MKELKTVSSNVKSLAEAALAETGGLLRLAPTWVPRSFLQPGRRLKLHPDDLYAFGLNRGGIDERWFASTTPAANESRTPDEGLSYVVHERRALHARATPSQELGGEIDRRRDLGQVQEVAGLQQVLRQHGPDPAPHAPERRAGRAGRPARASPRATTSRRSSTNVGNNFPYTFFGLEPGTTKARHPPLPGGLERGRQRHPRPLARPTASSPAPAGWSRPCVLHAPGSLVHLRAAVGLRRLRHVPVDGRGPRGALGAAGQGRARGEAPATSTTSSSSSTGRRTSTRTSRTTTTWSRSSGRRHARARATSTSWIVYGKVDGEQLFTAKELTVDPGAQGHDQGQRRLRPDRACRAKGRISKLRPEQPEADPLRRADRGRSLRHRAGRQGRRDVREHQRTEPLVVLRYFGPEVNPDAPAIKYKGDVKL